MIGEPGDFIKVYDVISDKEEEAQIVWTGTLSILRNHQVEHRRAMCVYLIERSRFKVIEVSHESTPYPEPYFYEKEIIGTDGL